MPTGYNDVSTNSQDQDEAPSQDIFQNPFLENKNRKKSLDKKGKVEYDGVLISEKDLERLKMQKER